MDKHVRELALRWEFEPESELPMGYCSRIYADSTRILKAPFQGEEITTGLVAARRMAGDVGPQIHAWDDETGTLLMDRVLPGTPLHRAGLTDEECLHLASTFIKKMRVYSTDALMPLSEYVDTDDPLAAQLLSTTPKETFLHGDLHHENILLGAEGWVVIDPKGLVGDPASEPAAFIRNPIPDIGDWASLSVVLEDRIQRFALELDLDPWRVWGWALVAVREGGTEPGHPWDKVSQALEKIHGAFFKGNPTIMRP